MGKQVGIPAIYQFAELSYQQFNAYADLPSAVSFAGKVCLVLTTTGVWFVNRKRKGLWRSDGAVWVRMGIAPTKEDMGLGVADEVEFSRLKLGATAVIKWLSGNLTIQTDKVGTNQDTLVLVRGKGTGTAQMRFYGAGGTEWVVFRSQWGAGYLYTDGTSPSVMKIQYGKPYDIECFPSTSSGNAYLKIFGFKTAVGLKWFRLRVNADGDGVIEAEQDLILPNLAGVGDRAVIADVNGKLSAP